MSSSGANAAKTVVVKLYSNVACPYAGRSWIAVKEAEKAQKLDCQYHEIDLEKKEQKGAEYLRINPLGKVPAIIYQRPGKPNVTICESLTINEFLQEVVKHDLLPYANSSGNHLKSADLHTLHAYYKAQARIWIHYFDQNIASKMMKILWNANDKEFVQKTLHSLQHAMHFMLQYGYIPNHIDDAEGPFFFGHLFSLVDIAVFPFLVRLEIILRKWFGLDIFDHDHSQHNEQENENTEHSISMSPSNIQKSLDQWKKWFEAMKSRESIHEISYGLQNSFEFSTVQSTFPNASNDDDQFDYDEFISKTFQRMIEKLKSSS